MSNPGALKYLTRANQLLLQNKWCVVTGANRGFGLATATLLAALGSNVVLASRQPDQAQKAIDQHLKPRMKQLVQECQLGETPQQQILAKPLDLADWDSCFKFVQAFPSDKPPFLLVNNAGVLFNQADKFELTMRTNYLAPAWLSLYWTCRSDQSVDPLHLIHISAGVHRTAARGNPLQSKDLCTNGWQAYCQSKLAQIMFSNYMMKLSDQGYDGSIASPFPTDSVFTSVCMDPGWLKTNLVRHEHGFNDEEIAKKQSGASMDIESGVSTLFYGLFHDPPLHGGFLARERAMKESADARDPDLQRKLWQYTLDMIPDTWQD